MASFRIPMNLACGGDRRRRDAYASLTFNALTFNALAAGGSATDALNGVAVEAVTPPGDVSRAGGQRQARRKSCASVEQSLGPEAMANPALLMV